MSLAIWIFCCCCFVLFPDSDHGVFLTPCSDKVWPWSYFSMVWQNMKIKMKRRGDKKSQKNKTKQNWTGFTIVLVYRRALMWNISLVWLKKKMKVVATRCRHPIYKGRTSRRVLKFQKDPYFAHFQGQFLKNYPLFRVKTRTILLSKMPLFWPIQGHFQKIPLFVQKQHRNNTSSSSLQAQSIVRTWVLPTQH